MEGIAQGILGAGVTAAFHPVTLTKVLIQIGHEPVAPSPGTSIFGRKVLCYPNLFKYLGHIRKQDGFFGMYRGLMPRLAGGLIGTYVTASVSVQLKGGTNNLNLPPTKDEVDGDEEPSALAGIQTMAKNTSVEVLARCAGVIVSQPFHVIMVRSMGQFVGGETAYSGLFSSIAEIYHHDGILGFFSGLVPRILGEVITIWLANTLTYLVNTHIVHKAPGGTDFKNYTGAIFSLMVTQLTYPFNVVSNNLAISGSGLAAGQPPNMPVYTNWLDCWRHLSLHRNLKRGSSLFMRQFTGPTITLHDGSLAMAGVRFS
ncbi:hypothetical protein CAPTEDRAFT_226268 [Capitella teleta]|uniref:Mitochondrial carrier homolog 2 n=1 Tax=Capitella teleta TaxID=283909 RepID=R7TP39_CAPTE|nr:hypothetical protein CAPTEDRAFT_226268 [Capitella teleta]|eukprot:ELT95424.1 hypothetical protein CAPTEDRAFT_226268 [Capitella teleta]